MECLDFNIQRFSYTGSSGNDSYSNNTSNTYVYSYGGHDTIKNYGNYVSVDTGNGNDTIDNRGNFSTIIAGDGNDFIHNDPYRNSKSTNNGRNSKLYGGYGMDTIVNFANNVSMYGGDDGDSLYNYRVGFVGSTSIYAGENVLMDGGAGNDYIYSGGRTSGGGKVTIIGGKGNDTIEMASDSRNNTIFYYQGDGNDIVKNYNSTDTIDLRYNSYTTETVGSDVVISVTNSGQITLVGAKGKKINIVNGYVGGKYVENTKSNILIGGSAYNDSIKNSGGSKVTITTGGGNDTIYNSFSNHKTRSNVSIVSGDGNDSIYNYYGSGATINAGSGNDTVNDVSGYSSIFAGEGKDYIYVGGYNATADGGNDDDTIKAYGENSSINGGAGNDRISLFGGNFNNKANRTVKGGTGNDVISVESGSGGNVYQYANGDGYDTIYGYTSNDKISLGGGYYTRETLSNGNVVVSLVSGGSMTLYNASSKTVNIVGGTLSVGGGDKDQKISNSKSNTTIRTASGKDTISNTGSTVQIYSGSGDDSIYSKADYNVTISSGDGNDKIYNAFTNYVSIESGAGADSIYGNNNWATINAGTDNDTIVGNHWRSKLNGNDGADLISITTYWYNTIDGGIGNDTIVAGGSEHSVAGGAGNDYISLSGGSLTIQGGTGDDTIYGDSKQSHLYQYSKGDGNDIIFGFGANDTLQINGVKYKKSKISGTNDIKVSLTGGSSIILKNAASLGLNNIKIVGEQDSDSNYTPQDVIKKFMKALDDTTYTGEDAMDAAVQACSNYKDFDDMLDKLVKDVKSYLSSDSVNGWKNFLVEKCDIVLEGTANEDTGAITGKDAGGSTTKTAVSVIPEPNVRNKNFSEDSFTTNGLTFKLGEYNSKTGQIDEKRFSDLKSDDERFIWQNLYSNWAREGLNLIEESYGYSFSDSELKCNTIYIYFDYDTSALAWTNNYHYGTTGRASDLMIGINMNIYKKYSDSDLNGIGYNKRGKQTEYLDRTFTHESVHAIMASKVKRWKDLPLSAIEGTAELVKGIDDTRPSTIEYLVKNPEHLRHCMGTEYTWEEYKSGTDEVYGAGYIMLRYLAKQASTGGDKKSFASAIVSNDPVPGVSLSGALMKLTKSFKESSVDFANYYSNVTKLDASTLSSGIVVYGSSAANSIKGTKGADTVFAGEGKDTVLGGTGSDVLYGEKDNDLLKGEAGDDTLYGGKGNDTLYGGNDEDILYGNAGDDKLLGEAGNDSLYGGEGNDTLTGGKGADVFIYKVGDGKDVITDYTAKDKDKIQIVNGTISQTLYSGNDVTFKIGDGSLTIQKGKSQKISIEYVDETQIYSGWFMEDDNNFTTNNDVQLDSVTEITADNYSAGNIENTSYNSLDYLQIASSSQVKIGTK